MRINLIGNFASNTGLNQDAMVLRGMLAAEYGEDVVIGRVHHVMPQCPAAELNIFIESINPSLFVYAGKNIWIPNTEWTYKTWVPYIRMVDEIWVKTREAETIFTGYTSKVKYIGWTSIDKGVPSDKNYHKGVVLVGKNMYRNPKQILRAYFAIKTNDIVLYKKLPELVIPYNSEHVNIFCPPELSDKITLLDKALSDSEYNSIIEECGLAICSSATEGFCHAVNEAMSSGCNLMLSPILPFKEMAGEVAVFLKELKAVDHPDCLGTILDVSVPSIIESLTDYVNSTFESKKVKSTVIRREYERRHSEFVDRMMPLLKEQPTEEYVFDKIFPKEEDLPDVSIVTLTRDRRVFMPLAHYSYLIQSYPEDKLEWVIVDDGDDPIEDTLIGIPNVKYVRCDTKLTIGQKRNLGVQNATYDTIAMVDDDDVYPNNSILFRVAMLKLLPARECVFCTTIPCYDIVKYSSFVNIPPNSLRMSERVSEATLCFTRDFWNSRNFSAVHVAEGDAFIHGREHMCREVSPEEVIVSLIHPKNTSSRRIPDIPEPNGCHYGFNEKLFAVVSEIGESLKDAEKLTTASSLA